MNSRFCQTKLLTDGSVLILSNVLEMLSFGEHQAWVKRTKIGLTLDSTLLKVDASQDQFDKLCEEAMQNGIGQVCVPGGRVESVVEKVKGSSVQVASVMAFPHGNGHSRVKAKEAEILLGFGVTELDMVMDVGKLKEKNYHNVQRDIRLVCEEALHRSHLNTSGGSRRGSAKVEMTETHQTPATAPPHPRIVKVILETCLLTDEEIIDACLLAVLAGAHFVKTSTGFSTSGATPHHVRLMKLTVGDFALVKASGGIRTYEDAIIMLNHGASRIGTSAALAIVQKSLSTPSQDSY